MKIFLASILSLIAFQGFAQCVDGNCGSGYGSSFINVQCDSYAGNFKNGTPNGKGKMLYANGDVYEGNWVEGEQQGDGTLAYHDGKTFTGQFRNNEFNGRGVYYNADGTIGADGFFESGQYIADKELMNSGSAYLETFKVNRLLEGFNMLEYPFVADFSDAMKEINAAGATGYKSLTGENAAQNARGQKGREGKIKVPGAKGCYALTDVYMADYGEFSTLQDAVKKFVEVCSQLMAYDKNFTIINDVSGLESPNIKRYLFYNDNGDTYEESWMYLSIYEWKAEHKYFVELGCGFGAGIVMKVIPNKDNVNKVFAANLVALLNDADNSFRNFTVNDGAYSCTADVDPLYCSNLRAELPGLGKLKYIELANSDVYKGVSGYIETPATKYAEKTYQNLVREVKNALGEGYVYTEFGNVEDKNLEIVFASLSEIHNDRAPLIRINVAEGAGFSYQVVLSIQFDRFEIISRDLSLAW